MSQEMVKGLQISFQELITQLNAGLSMLMEQIKGLNDKIDNIQQQLQDNQKQIIGDEF